jgi:Holliday junction resolvase
MGGMSRQKGKRGEREAAAELGQLLGVTARRGVQYQGGPDSPDVVLDGVAIHVEAKRTEKLTLWPAIEQARADAPTGKVPIVWHRPNRRGSVVIVETARLLELAREIVRAADSKETGDGSPNDIGLRTGRDASREEETQG